MVLFEGYNGGELRPVDKGGDRRTAARFLRRARSNGFRVTIATRGQSWGIQAAPGMPAHMEQYNGELHIC